MKPYLLALSSCALALTACKGSIGSPKAPAWVDAQPCQKELPAVTDYEKGAPLGDESSVVVIDRGQDGVVAWVVSPKDGMVTAGHKINPDDYSSIWIDMGDRIAGSIVRPTPPPPPGGWDKMRDIIGTASRVSRLAPAQCAAPMMSPKTMMQ